jgi:hypothetical protein
MKYWSREDTKAWVAQLEDRIEDISHYIDKTLEWCEEKQKTPEFTSAITCIASKLEGDIEEQIRRELDNERARKVGQSKQPEKKHLHAATVYAWLTGGKEDEFLKWYSEQYEKTQLFDSLVKVIKVFELDEIVFNKALDHMCKMDYINFNGNSYEKIIY